MWLMTTFGFFSVVCAHGKGGKPHPKLMMIRARNKAHLTALRRRFTGLPEITTNTGTDYPHRIIAPRRQVLEVVFWVANGINYTNFKNAAHTKRPKDRAYHGFLSTVWGNGLRLTPPVPGVRRGGFWDGRGEVWDPTAPDHNADAAFA